MNNLPLLRMKHNKLSQTELAEMVDVSLSTLQGWEKDIGRLRVKHLVKLCKIFDVTPNELLGYESIVLDNKEE